MPSSLCRLLEQSGWVSWQVVSQLRILPRACVEAACLGISKKGSRCVLKPSVSVGNVSLEFKLAN